MTAPHNDTPAPGFDGQRIADQGDGTFRNPVLAGDRPDPNILRDGDDYYAAFSTFVSYPGAVIWHSRDLVSWRPVGPAVTKPLGSIYALDLVRHDGRYFLYIPVGQPRDPVVGGFPIRNYVVWADHIEGPWSEPIDLNINGLIDPGHVLGEDGKRYLFFNAGYRVRLSDDGLRVESKPEKVYDGWNFPADWVVESRFLEGPKLLWKDGWLYMFSADGGTGGVPTSHMVIVARARSVNGPWENCPHNPIVRTTSVDEPWWSRGHATPVEATDGSWWLTYHGYEHGLRTLGRQMLLDPMAWDADGWPYMRGGDLDTPLVKPAGMTGPAGVALSGPFTPNDLGARIAFYDPKENYLDRVAIEGGVMTLAAQGSGPADSSPATIIAGDPHYAVEIDLRIDDGAQGGLLLFYNDKLFCGLGVKGGVLHSYGNGQLDLLAQYSRPLHNLGDAVSLRVVNDHDVATFFVATPEGEWRLHSSFEVSGYNHNIGGGFLSLRPALFASGTGSVAFANLRYRGLG